MDCFQLLKICNLHEIKTLAKTNHSPHNSRLSDYLFFIVRMFHGRFCPVQSTCWVILPKVHSLAKPVIRILAIIQTQITIYKLIAKGLITAVKPEYQIVFYRIHRNYKP